MWGHDFRPDYLFIRRALEALGEPSRARHDRHRDARRGGTRSRLRSAATSPSSGRASSGRTFATTSRRSAATRIACASSSSGCGRLERRAARSSTPARGTPASASRGRSAATGSGSSTTTPVSRPDERSRVQDDFVSGPDPWRRRDDGIRDGDRQAGRPLRLPLQLPRLARELRADGRPRRPGRRAERDAAAREPVRRHRRATLRGRRHSRARTTCGSVYRAIRDLGGTVDPTQLAGRRPRPARARRHARAGRDRAARLRRRAGRCAIELLAVDAGSRQRSSTTCSPAMRARRRPGSSGSCDFAESTAAATRRWPSTSARRFEHALRRLRRLRPAAASRAAAAAARAASRRRGRQRSCAPSSASRWPLGRRSLVAMLRGSVSAPPSARASLAFGVLEAASDAEVKRWVKALEAAGALVEVETTTASGCSARVPDARPAVARAEERRPGGRLGRRAAALLAARALAARTACRRTSCSTTRRCATSRRRGPRSLHELAAVKGFGPTKIERYGDDVLAVVASSADAGSLPTAAPMPARRALPLC